MMIGNTIVRTCKTCGAEFPHTIKGRGRFPDHCPPHSAERAAVATARYRETEKYREGARRAYEAKLETYNPWLWENTILEWDE